MDAAPDPFVIFKQGRMFHSASLHLRRKDDPYVLSHVHPSFLLAYVAAELYLKALLLQHTGRTFRGHNLKNLLRCLPAPTQKAIRRKWEPYHQRLKAAKNPPMPIPETLEDALREGAFMYEHSRYVWETRPESLFILCDLPDALLEAIGGLNPNWEL